MGQKKGMHLLDAPLILGDSRLPITMNIAVWFAMRFTLWHAMDMLHRWAHGSYSGMRCDIVRFAVVADRAIHVAIIIEYVVVHHWVYSRRAI